MIKKYSASHASEYEGSWSLSLFLSLSLMVVRCLSLLVSPPMGCSLIHHCRPDREGDTDRHTQRAKVSGSEVRGRKSLERRPPLNNVGHLSLSPSIHLSSGPNCVTVWLLEKLEVLGYSLRRCCDSAHRLCVDIHLLRCAQCLPFHKLCLRFGTISSQPLWYVRKPYL